ncbi:MAG TPA: histidinol dehydrogenase [Candidatus Limiplasma sp.]|nr:histidinol dehydrogenase [Candidatus Limiplasma sp.]
MIRIIEYADQPLEALLNRASVPTRDVTKVVQDVLDDVRARGDEAALAYSKKFDGADLTSLVATAQEIDAGYARVEPALLATMRRAAENITRYHEKQKREGFIDAREDGVVLGQRVLPLASVGLYVPGGTARYPSSVLMAAIPAKIAGVGRIVMTTPPDKSGNIPDVILAAAKIAGITEIVKLGGAQAVAALAYGTQTIQAVDKILGPGNIYVTTAKQLCFAQGVVSIDTIAGPSEIMVISDSKSKPAYLAADLLSQAEHDVLAASWLITDSQALATQVQMEIEQQLVRLERREIARKSVDNNGRIIVVPDLKIGCRIANAIAPEHLELCVDEPFAWLPLIQNAGSIFLGRYCPETLGDYMAGPNHTLPTSGAARFASPLGLDDFCKRSSYLFYSRDALQSVGVDAQRFALSEGLTAHARAVSIRMEDMQ